MLPQPLRKKLALPIDCKKMFNLTITKANLKSGICEAGQAVTLRVNLVQRQISVCVIDEASSDPDSSTDLQTLRRRLQGLNLLLPRSLNTSNLRHLVKNH